MRSFYFFLIPILFSCTQLKAQAYFPLLKKGITYYGEGNNVINLSLYLTDSTTINHTTYYKANTTLVHNGDNSWCNVAKNSFLGKYFYMQGDTAIHFINYKDLAFTLYTHTNVNDKWIAYAHDMDTVWAKHTNTYTQFEYGVLDTIKEFEFTFSSYYEPITINLSKHFGFKQITSFYSMPHSIDVYSLPYPIPFKFISATALDSIDRNITGFDIFNYDVGDELHTLKYYYYHYFDRINQTSSIKFDSVWRICKILQKTETDSSFIYLTQNRIYGKTSSGEYIKDTNYLETFVYKNALIDQPGMIESGWHGEYGRQIYIIVPWNGIPTKVGILHYFYIGSDSCMDHERDATKFSNTYIKGLGGGYYAGGYYTSPMDYSYHGLKLLYYKKGNATWGKPLPQNVGLNDLADQQKEKLIHVYPNPAQQFITIEPLIKGPLVFTLYDCTSKQVFQETITQNEKVELPLLTNGIYYYTVSNGDLMHYSKLLIQR